MKVSKWYIIGIGLFGLVMGYLVGASNSPVVGAMLAAIVPLASAIASAFGAKKDNFKEKEGEGTLKIYSKIYTKFIGVALAFFSIFLFFGLFIGEYHRRFDLLSCFRTKQVKIFPWVSKSAKKPKDLNEAIKWINTSEGLTRLGYSHENIQKMYELNLEYQDSVDIKVIVPFDPKIGPLMSKFPPSGLEQIKNQ